MTHEPHWMWNARCRHKSPQWSNSNPANHRAQNRPVRNVIANVVVSTPVVSRSRSGHGALQSVHVIFDTKFNTNDASDNWPISTQEQCRQCHYWEIFCANSALENGDGFVSLERHYVTRSHQISFSVKDLILNSRKLSVKFRLSLATSIGLDFVYLIECSSCSMRLFFTCLFWLKFNYFNSN